MAEQPERHPPGLVVLFLTEMWERFSFYSMIAMFVLYMRDPKEGFGWSFTDATRLFSDYLMFVYASPFVGGLLADWKLGYRRAVLLGGLFFMAGHLLLAFSSLTAVYAALVCLVIGNGFFKPNVSTMVGNLYPEGSRLKERAYNIFYMGINIGATAAPIVAEFVKGRFGFHVAFAVAAFGMLISVSILWTFRRLVEDPAKAAQPAPDIGGEWRKAGSPVQETRLQPGKEVHGVAPAQEQFQTQQPVRQDRPDVAGEEDEAERIRSRITGVSEARRIGALVVIFLVVIVFWMVFNQGGTTITDWGDKNTDWEVSGIISNAINPFWVITLTFPLIWFWRWLNGLGLEPSTPTKMAIGMVLAGAAYFVLYAGARLGEATAPTGSPYDFKMSPAWLIGAYAVMTLGELMLSPMGLALVAQVAPRRLRGVMMGGWFVSTAIGGKLSVIGVYWEEWLHSTFFAVLGAMALGMAAILFLLLKPLKKAMPGV
jgi:POT family proton-dependent oligopeptide transporter